MGSDEADRVEREYDVCLSFAGEQRPYVERVAHHLQSYGVRVFYDTYEEVELWGKDLYEHLDWVYQHAARYCVLFASSEYAAKVWTSHERRSAQARALVENFEYVLPVRFDDAVIPGLRPTVKYADARTTTELQLVDQICRKLGKSLKKNYLPPDPFVLFDALSIVNSVEKEYVKEVAHSFMREMMRATLEERRLIGHIFLFGCGSHLPDNVHMSLDLIYRDLRIAPDVVLAMLRRASSLGFEHRLGELSEDHVESDLVELSWLNHMSYNDEELQGFSSKYATLVAVKMVQVGAGNRDGCLQCFYIHMDQLDFSNLELSDDAGGA